LFLSAHLDRHHQGVTITAKNGTNHSVTIRANRTIVTVPLGVLKAGHIEFSPELPKSKLKSIKDMGYELNNVGPHAPIAPIRAPALAPALAIILYTSLS
jgi:hypothetical protein